MMESAAFQIYVVCSSVLVLNLLFLANGTALSRARSGRFTNPEDQRLNPNGHLQLVDEGLTARYRRAHLNALENILPFLGVGFLLLLTGPSTMVAALLFGGFTLFRLLHSLAYIKSLQPLRTISFAMAALTLVGVVGTAVVRVLIA